MANHSTGDPELPPPYLGDYPDGLFWAAYPPPGAVSVAAVADDDHFIGDALRFMWDYGISIPLWDGGGPREDPDWLARVLGLTDGLITNLADWGAAMEHLDSHPELRTDAAYADLDRRARTLVDTVREEVGPSITVRYVPW